MKLLATLLAAVALALSLNAPVMARSTDPTVAAAQDIVHRYDAQYSRMYGHSPMNSRQQSLPTYQFWLDTGAGCLPNLHGGQLYEILEMLYKEAVKNQTTFLPVVIFIAQVGFDYEPIISACNSGN
jgi:hypothetical protein